MNLFKQAVARWGKGAQLDQLVEECCELVAAVQHFKRNKITIEQVAEEIADVRIMIQQMSEVFDSEVLDDAYARKIHQLSEKLEKCKTG